MTEKYLTIGERSSGTLRTEDLLTAALDTLQEVDPGREAQLVDGVNNAAIMAGLENDALDGDVAEQAGFFLNELEDELQEHCAPYTYYGSTPDDGACFGVWADFEAIDSDYAQDVLKVEAGVEWPETDRDYVLEVNDHGNATLWDRRAKKVIWAVV